MLPVRLPLCYGLCDLAILCAHCLILYLLSAESSEKGGRINWRKVPVKLFEADLGSNDVQVGDASPRRSQSRKCKVHYVLFGVMYTYYIMFLPARSVDGKVRGIDGSQSCGPRSGIVHPRTMNYPVDSVFFDTHDHTYILSLLPARCLVP